MNFRIWYLIIISKRQETALKVSELKDFGRMDGMVQQFSHGLTESFSNSSHSYHAEHGYGTSPRNGKADTK